MTDIALSVSVDTGIADVDQARADLHDLLIEWCGARGFDVVVTHDDHWLERDLAGALRMMIAQAEANDCVIEHTHDAARAALARYDAIYSETGNEAQAEAGA